MVSGLSESALAIARREGNQSLEIATLFNSGLVDHFQLHFRAAIVKFRLTLQLSHSATDLFSEMVAHYFLGLALILVGDLLASQQHMEAALSLAQTLRARFWLTTCFWGHGIISQIAGRWVPSRDFSDRGLARSPRDSRLLTTRVLLEYETGNFHQAQACLETLLEVMKLTPPGPGVEYAGPAVVLPAGARIIRRENREEEAAAAADVVRSSRDTTPMYRVNARAGPGPYGCNAGGFLGG